MLQIPGVSTRRGAHGMARTLDGAYIHQADRVQNVVEVIDTASSHIGLYDLASANGQIQVCLIMDKDRMSGFYQNRRKCIEITVFSSNDCSN